MNNYEDQDEDNVNDDYTDGMAATDDTHEDTEDTYDADDTDDNHDNHNDAKNDDTCHGVDNDDW